MKPGDPMLRAAPAPTLFDAVVGPTRPPFEPREVKPDARGSALTSQLADKSVNRKADYACILQWLATRGGGTHDEWCAVHDRNSSTSGRFTELRDAGLIRDTGETRKTRSGRAAAVYVVTEAGVQFTKG